MFNLKEKISGRIERAQEAIESANLDMLFIVGREWKWQLGRF